MIILVPDTNALDSLQDWDVGKVTITEEQVDVGEWTQSHMQGCISQNIAVFETVTTQKPCVIHGKNFSVARFVADGCNQSCYAFRVGSQDTYHRSDMRIDQSPVFVPGTDKILFNQKMYNSAFMYAPVYFDDIRDLLIFSDESKTYSINRSLINPTYALRSPDGGGSFAKYIGKSRDATWVSFSDSIGVVLVNTNDLTLRRITEEPMPYGATVHSSISSDGKYMVIGGKNTNYTRVYLIQNCGELKVTTETALSSGNSQCSHNDISSRINNIFGNVWYSNYEFNETGGAFSVYFDRVDGYTQYKTKLTINKYREPNVFSYLALGDSYSSGEGDVQKTRKDQFVSHYLPGTDHVGGCHLSLRSYPYLLAQSSQVSSDLMKSVACSGAMLTRDYSADVSRYKGQGDRYAKLSDLELKNRQDSALDSFFPGVVPQLEFVKKTQPKTVTLTGGGNDAGFGPILAYCANVLTKKHEPTATCDYAKKNSRLRPLLANTIEAQYANMRSFIQSLKSASPNTTVYVVGYPTFVSSDRWCLNTAALNQAERQMINNAVEYMNSTLRAAAVSSGAHYLDIENALHGGRLCEKSKYITGLTDIAGKGFRERWAELFHPNAAGHEQMAQNILNAGFVVKASNNPVANQQTTAPLIPEYFQAKQKGRSTQKKLVDSNTVRKYEKLTFSSTGYKAKSQVSLEMVGSAPISLGSVKTDSQGGFVTDIMLPQSVDSGYQVLVATGEDAQSKALNTYQFIEVVSSTQADSDEDGIVDGKDTCRYISEWRDETTGENVCRSEIGNLN